MTEKTEWLRGWAAPALLVGLLVQGVTGVTAFNGVSNTAQNNKEGLAKVETRVHALEAASGASGARLAVMESQLASALKVLERIDARMEANRGG